MSLNVEVERVKAVFGPERWLEAIAALDQQDNLEPVFWLPELSMAAAQSGLTFIYKATMAETTTRTFASGLATALELFINADRKVLQQPDWCFIGVHSTPENTKVIYSGQVQLS